MPLGETEILSRNPWVVRRKISVAEYHRMGEVGILTPTDRVELIEGEIVAMAPIGSDHAGTSNWLNRALVIAVGNDGVVAVGNPVRLDNWSEPQPDFTVLRYRPDSYRGGTPQPEDVLLAIEVSMSSLRFDRSVKATLYASHGIAEYWIVDIAARSVEVYRDPAPEGYRSVAVLKDGEVLQPNTLPNVSITVSELMGT